MLIKYMFGSKSQTLRMRYPLQSTEEFVNHEPQASDLQILLVFYQHPACFISL